LKDAALQLSTRMDWRMCSMAARVPRFCRTSGYRPYSSMIFCRRLRLMICCCRLFTTVPRSWLTVDLMKSAGRRWGRTMISVAAS